MSTAVPASSNTPTSTGLTWLALFVALVASAGSLWLTLKMDLIACALCFPQRAFAFGAAAVLLLGLLTGAGQRTSLGLLALPLAAGGVGVAGFHVWLEWTEVLECPEGIFGVRTAPQQSLAAFAILLVILLGDVAMNRHAICCGWFAAIGALVLGGACAYGCIVSSPKLPAKPTQPYPSNKIDTCRRPFVIPE